MTTVSSGQTAADRATATAAILEQLRAVGGGSRGGPRIWMVDGPEAIGRTTFLDELGAAFSGRARAERGAGSGAGRLLRAAGVAWESGSEHGVLRQLLALPVGAAWPGPFEAAAELVSALPGEGVSLVLLDDADLADDASLAALVTAARHHPDVPFVLVMTRSTDRSTLLPTAARSGYAASQQVLDHAGATTVRLGPLSTQEVALLAARTGVPLTASQVEHLTLHTRGVPRHVSALLASVPADTWRGRAPALPAPLSVAVATLEQLACLGGPARALVEAVAVLHDPVLLAIASAVAGLEDVAPAVDEAERSGLLVVRDLVSSVVLQLPDPMVRAAVRAHMGMARRTDLHRVAAQTVDDPAASLEHAVEATTGPDDALAERLHGLATRRGAEGAWAEAARLLLLASRSSSERGRAEERLLFAVDAMVGAGDVPAAAGFLAEIESLPETVLSNAVLGYLAILRGRAGEADLRLTRAWALTRAGRAPAVAAMVAQRLVLHHLARCEGAELVLWADRAVDLVGSHHPTAVEAQAIRGLGLGSTGRTPAALESYESLLGRASHGAVGQRVQMGAGWLHLATDHVDAARVELEGAVPTDFLGGSSRISLWAQGWLARAHFASGDWDRALEVSAAGLGRAERTGMVLLVPLLRWTETQVFALRGDWERAEASARAAGPASQDYQVMRVPGCLGRAALAEARADYAGVLTALAPLLRADVPADVAEPGFWPWPDVYANALVIQNRYDEAETFLDEHEARAADRSHRSAQARLAYARGRLLGGRGLVGPARDSFERALDLLQQLPLPYDRARVNFAYGQTLRRAGKRREADAVITAARDDYLTLGATTYVLRCERELRAGGVRGVLRDRPAQALTPQEQAVAGLVAQGLSNREVAAELFLSVKTVQFHLTRVYAKLGIRSRGELAADADTLLGDRTR